MFPQAMSSDDEKKKKYLIIKYGPPASGKSNIDDMVKKKYNIPDDELYVSSIDSLVENSKEYKEMLNETKCQEFFRKTKDLMEAEKDKKKIDECTRIYINARNMLNIADVVSREAEQARIDGKHIIYETTGCHGVHWLVDELKNHYKPLNYRIVLFYPVVDAKTLAERSYQRAKKIGRYANSEFINKCVSESMKNLGHLREYIDELYVYDNTKFDMNDEIFSINDNKCSISELYNQEQGLPMLSYQELQTKITNLIKKFCPEESKSGGLDSDFVGDSYNDLYGDFIHGGGTKTVLKLAGIVVAIATFIFVIIPMYLFFSILRRVRKQVVDEKTGRIL